MTSTLRRAGAMRLYLVRHPPPAIEAGICYGRSDMACAPADVAAALAALLPQLPANLANPVEVAVYSSPSMRCTALAQALPGVVATHDARLMELDFGDWEMRSWDAIPRAEIDAWAADPVGYRPGGGESVRQMAVRVLAFYRELAAADGGPGAAVVVCHAGTMRLLAACAPDGGSAGADAIAAIAAAAPHRYAYGSVLVLP